MGARTLPCAPPFQLVPNSGGAKAVAIQVPIRRIDFDLQLLFGFHETASLLTHELGKD
jgi:hypothetical protein